MSVYQCPACQSENTSKLSLIHDQGMTRSKGTTWVGKDVGLYYLKSQSKASKAAGAPTARSTDTNLGLAVKDIISECRWSLIFWFATMCLWARAPYKYPIINLIYLIVIIYYIIRVIIKRSQNISSGKGTINDYPELLERWNNSYQCLRCSNIFQINQN
jgi:hypothetical protein